MSQSRNMTATSDQKSEEKMRPAFADSISMQGLQPILDPSSGLCRKSLSKKNSSPPFDGLDFTPYHQPGLWEAFYSVNGHKPNDTIKQCRWEVGDCGIENFTTTFTDFGFCFVFNGDGRLKARNSGRDYGLRLSLNTQQEEYLRSFADHYGAGFKVAIHPYGLPPILSEKGISVGPGFHTSLAVDISKLKNADASVSKCGSKELKHYRDTPYSIQACRQECLSDYVVSKCGCKEVFMKRNDTLICDPPELFSCVYPSIDDYVKNVNKDCEKSCPGPCSTFIYDTTPSAAPLSEYFLEEYSHYKGHNASYWRKNFVELEIYLTSMSYQYIEKRLSYTLLDLLCDVGGALGLLLGASFLTVLEIIDFVFVRTRGCRRGSTQTKMHVNKVHVKGDPRY
ncbi:acid-sensing ion channel 3-like [Haliotis rubra]|uniref:acid-sensing ion channel 3-like n=1 Tax=Haliotis rubra TaxID=36100 RepID=UPI001EE58795|nr:acid-sensing ion channel 3-like [Haliotis rubra]